MKHYRASTSRQIAAMGYTDLFVVTHADLTTTTNNTAESEVLDALAIGDIVDPKMLLEVKTNANVVASVTASVGVTGALTQFIGNSNLLAAGDEYYAPAGSVGAYATIASGKSLEMNFIPGASNNVDEITAGEFWLWCNISRKSERDIQA
jgi:hypothetical protein